MRLESPSITSVQGAPAQTITTEIGASIAPSTTVTERDVFEQVHGQVEDVLAAVKVFQPDVKHFWGVGKDEYAIIMSVLAERSARHELRARLTYFSDIGMLALHSPHPCHEQPVNDLVNDLVLSLSSMQYNKEHANLDIDTNNSLIRENLSTVPDLQVRLSLFSVGLQAPTECLWIGESGFSQSKVSIIRKMKKAVEKEPGILLAIAILVKEQSPYHPPEVDSNSAKALRSRPYRNETEFLPGLANPIELTPVTVEGHVWVNVESIEWHVWLRGASPIDFDESATNPNFAKGTLFPSLQMTQVDVLLVKGLAAIHGRLLHRMQEIWPNDHHEALASWIPTLNINWKVRLIRLASAIRRTAHVRYTYWYHNNVKKRKGQAGGGDTAGPSKKAKKEKKGRKKTKKGTAKEVSK